MNNWTRSVPILALLMLVFASRNIAAQNEERRLGWFDTGELSFVAARGNSRTSTFGFRNMLSRVWEKAQLSIEAKGLRTTTTNLERTAVGTSPSDYREIETSASEVTAENYVFRGKYDRNVSARFFWYAEAGWDRNEFAGIRNRYQTSGGLGNVWFDNDDTGFRTDYGLSVTRQQDVAAADRFDDFAGVRVSADYRRRLSTNTTYHDTSVLDESFKDTKDIRIDWTNSLSVAMTEKLALKLSLQLLFDNQPSLVTVPLVLPDGNPTDQTVLVAAGKLDTLFTIAFVADF